ncbi:MAG: 2-C-methyl-D-erythritol 4-phosphate cytidylyltransferase [Endozoicomonas sp. (ex Botrylloides leachii)]|nr:2-C-methyl-D-erythritol 4-phosphate cytidylyltransferase [Endozoicomonas sp. (ex Botrylloides leachii)]
MIKTTADQRREPKYWALVPAAGTGQRMKIGTPKQYLEIRGKTLIEHTLERLIEFPLFEKIVVVLRKEDNYRSSLDIFTHEKILLADGGPERYHSVINGLQKINMLAADNDWIMVHDAVRPCIRQADLEWLVECVRNHEVGGLLGAMVKDTIKRTSIDGSIIETVDRSELWHAFTPQMFKRKPLEQALTRVITDKVSVTDEASAMEYSGYHPLMVEGHGDNIKVTQGVDLALASLYIEQQSKLIESP